MPELTDYTAQELDFSFYQEAGRFTFKSIFMHIIYMYRVFMSGFYEASSF